MGDNKLSLVTSPLSLVKREEKDKKRVERESQTKIKGSLVQYH